MTIQEAMKEMGIDYGNISDAFGYKDVKSYYHSTRRPKIEAGVVTIYRLAKKSVGKKNMVEQARALDEDATT